MAKQRVIFNAKSVPVHLQHSVCANAPLSMHNGQSRIVFMALQFKRSLRWVLATLWLTGCAQSQSGSKSPNVQLNSAPKSAYMLDIQFTDIPQPAQQIEVFGFYRVENAECVKALPLSGAVLPPEHRLVLPLHKVADGRYRTEFYQDALRDENYFDLGICRWRLQNIAAYFSSPATRFTASLSNSQSRDETTFSATRYFLHRDYFEKPKVGTIVFGEDADFYRPGLSKQFQVRLSAKKQ
jgi:hypothetical protein